MEVLRGILYITVCLSFTKITASKNCWISGLPSISCTVHEIGQNSKKSVVMQQKEEFHIFCYDGEKKHIFNIWKTISIRIHSHLNDYEFFRGPNETIIIKEFVESRTVFNFPYGPLPWQTGKFDLTLYNRSCIGIYSKTGYVVSTEINHINFWRVCYFAVGILLYFSSSCLSRNAVFYYSSGVLIGIFGSILVIVFLLSRLIPRRVGAITMLVGGWAFALYCFQALFSNLTLVFYRYQNFAIAYLVIVGFLSFAICYKYGQVKDRRTQNLIRWIMQAMALLLIFFSTEWHEASTSAILATMVIYNFPHKWKMKLYTYWRRKFPPKVNLLTEDEYHEQAVLATRAALEDLKKHCSSPDCQAWKLIKRLNKPLRFAEFVNGESHLTDEEILNYEMESVRRSDDSSSDEYSEDEHVDENGDLF